MNPFKITHFIQNQTMKLTSIFIFLFTTIQFFGQENIHINSHDNYIVPFPLSFDKSTEEETKIMNDHLNKQLSSSVKIKLDAFFKPNNQWDGQTMFYVFKMKHGSTKKKSYNFLKSKYTNEGILEMAEGRNIYENLQQSKIIVYDDNKYDMLKTIILLNENGNKLANISATLFRKDYIYQLNFLGKEENTVNNKIIFDRLVEKFIILNGKK